MVDDTNPTSQFHPYQPQDATPQTGSPKSGWSSMLSRVGIDSSKIDAITRNFSGSNVSSGLSKVRSAAANNSGLVLGSLAALAIGAGVLRGRSMMSRRSMSTP